jgi:hypothetical protein
MNCLECGSNITYEVFDYSVKHFGVPLCRPHQDWLKGIPDETTDEALALYFALKERDVPAEIEKFDGFKTIDIAVPEAKVNIEIDGSQHNWSHKQALADLRRTYYSFKKGYLTLRIPNSLVNYHLEETADLITEILVVNRSNNRPKFKYKPSR